MTVTSHVKSFLCCIRDTLVRSGARSPPLPPLANVLTPPATQSHHHQRHHHQSLIYLPFIFSIGSLSFSGVSFRIEGEQGAVRASLRPKCAEAAGPKAREKRRDVRNENEKKVVRVRDDFFLLFVPRFSYFCAATSAIWRLKLVIIWLAFFPIYNYSIRVCECGGGVALLLAFSFSDGASVARRTGENYYERL